MENSKAATLSADRKRVGKKREKKSKTSQRSKMPRKVLAQRGLQRGQAARRKRKQNAGILNSKKKPQALRGEAEVPSEGGVK